ncbi:pyruvate, water dikinase regulatory protein [Neomegalonema sp.]|uniref:pyruvate, water dikinase regulatory protein n=1 Tax=Neomegalonema sp. TaxID=2039713 RepID=UPI00261B1D54|nr:pyruvate, water dikinase regulatory protein [Neomegalonema sp.]MDD2867106.1 kinase/pyrophosphorylase [Neomegalonema sp.]
MSAQAAPEASPEPAPDSAGRPAGGLPQVHILSDSTGDTLRAALRAVSGQFRHVAFETRAHTLIRSLPALDRAFQEIAAAPGLVMHSVVTPQLRARLEEHCRRLGLPNVALLDPAIAAMAAHLDSPPNWRPGGQHEVDVAYYARMAAIDFAMEHDDGEWSERLRAAEVLLIGVSRTSKTPTCVYLAGKGVKAANLPLTSARPPPPALFEFGPDEGPLLVGLTAKPARLAQIRAHRLQSLRQEDGRGGDYAEVSAIQREVVEALKLFERLRCPVIDVTRRSIEETAAAVMSLLEARGRARRAGVPFTGGLTERGEGS